MSTDRAIVRVQLSALAKKKLDALCDRRGMTQIAVMSRVVDWFVKQDELIQTSVLSQLSPKSQAELARQLLERLADPHHGPA